MVPYKHWDLLLFPIPGSAFKYKCNPHLKHIKHDTMDEKAIDGWFQLDYVLNSAKGTETE